jgi:hypothetical protein
MIGVRRSCHPDRHREELGHKVGGEADGEDGTEGALDHERHTLEAGPPKHVQGERDRREDTEDGARAPRVDGDALELAAVLRERKYRIEAAGFAVAQDERARTDLGRAAEADDHDDA